ncbi:MAG: 5-(carboxyamino)imidazole ribonucleotide synthase [Rhodospirillaceae bacterium]
MSLTDVSAPVAPGGTIGILGGGQLGRMIALAAARLGYRCHIFTPEKDSPAAQVAAACTVAAYDDRTALAAFAKAVDVVTLEFENVPVVTVEFLAQTVAVRPGAQVLAVAQDRVSEKTFFNTFTETAPWRAVNNEADLAAAVAALGTPSILKTTRLGYDGKGQTRIEADTNLSEAWAAIGRAPAILEGFVTFEREISVIVARAPDGAEEAYCPVQNEHRHHILDTTTAPAPIPDAVAEAAMDIARRAATDLDLIGLLAVEMFVTADGRVLVNEMAPRPHNSGHWTMDACYTDQFEQLVRAVCGLPLGSPQHRCGAVMKNLLGDDAHDWHAILSDPKARLHLYGKAEARAGRKMGHVNYLKD